MLSSAGAESHPDNVEGLGITEIQADYNTAKKYFRPYQSVSGSNVTFVEN